MAKYLVVVTTTHWKNMAEFKNEYVPDFELLRTSLYSPDKVEISDKNEIEAFLERRKYTTISEAKAYTIMPNYIMYLVEENKKLVSHEITQFEIK